MRRAATALIALLALLAPAALAAQGWVMPRPCRPACPPNPGPARVVRTASDVRVELADGVLRYEVSETFVNRGAGLGEADYLFPLPGGAALQDLRLSIDGTLVAGETLGAEEARRVYEDIVRSQRDPALVEWMGHGLLRARIFPLPSGEPRRVVVRFQQVARREGDAVRVDYFRAGRARADRDAPLATGRAGGAPERGPRETFVLTVPASAAYGEPYSPTHDVEVRREGGVRRAAVRDASGDVSVLVPVRRAGGAAITVLAHASSPAERFALVTVSLPEPGARHTPRDVTLVLDVSGSMSGRKMEQAREAGRQLLRTLRREDRFRVVDFSTDVRAFPEPLSGDAQGPYAEATEANLRAAERYLAALEASGSTNIEGALREALRPRAAAGRLPLVLFVTDGEPTVGERRPEALADSARAWRGGLRLFTFGLGADVNTALLERLALDGRGTAQFVRPAESVERAVSVVASRLAAPVAADVRVRVGGCAEDGRGACDVRLASAMPNDAVDVFAGQDLVVLARYTGSGPARVRVDGRTARGAETWTAEARFPEREPGNRFVPRLWATQRVGWLAAEARRVGGSPEVDAEIRSLGERYGIPTPFTSYLVREPQMVAGGATGAVERVRRGGAAPPPVVAAPAADARVGAFEAARQASAQRGARSVAAADAIAAEASGAAASSAPATRRAGGRTFALVDGVWTDARLAPSAGAARRVVRVRAYSDAYFAVVRALPELREALALGERVRVAGEGVELAVGPDGAARLTPAELAGLVGAW